MNRAHPTSPVPLALIASIRFKSWLTIMTTRLNSLTPEPTMISANTDLAAHTNEFRKGIIEVMEGGIPVPENCL